MAVAEMIKQLDVLDRQAEKEKIIRDMRMEMIELSTTEGQRRLWDLEMLGATAEEIAKAKEMMTGIEALQNKGRRAPLTEPAQMGAALESRFLTFRPGERFGAAEAIIRNGQDAVKNQAATNRLLQAIYNQLRAGGQNKQNLLVMSKLP
jgi:hypothetical protein